MTKDILEKKISEVICILEREISSGDRGIGVYKQLLKMYTESMEECRNGNLNKVRIKGTIRFFYDSLADPNAELEKKMDEAIEALASLQGK